MNVKLVPISRYHQRIIALAIHDAKPKSNDRDLMDAWVNICTEVGKAIRGQGGQFSMDAWLNVCYYGPE